MKKQRDADRRAAELRDEGRKQFFANRANAEQYRNNLRDARN